MDDITRRTPGPIGTGAAPTAELTAYGVSECGPFRSGNEDAFSFDLDAGLFVVADGMGGHAAGEIAARLVVESILGFVERSQGAEDLTWPDVYDPLLSFNANRLRTALDLANRRVLRAGASRDDYKGMGATVVAVLFGASTMVVAHAGDSRVYAHHDGQLTPLTKDDALAALPGAGVPNADGRPAARRNIVTNAVGGDTHIDIHVSEHARRPGMLLLLCSDGVHGALDDARIRDILASRDGIQHRAESLVAAAIAAGGRDNATALIVADREHT